MSTIPREFIELLLAKIDIVDLINTYIPLRKKSGSNYFARCPFHQEKSGSFSVSQPKQFYYCFGCGAHGNAIDFMMNHDHLNFPEAIESLARQVSMEVPKAAGQQVKKDDSIAGLFDLMIEISQYYYEQMKLSPRAIQYLKNRGISGQIAQQFQLGYSLPGWSHVLDLFGKTDADKKKLLDTGLIIKKNEGGYYDRFRDRVMYPIHDYRGRMIGFGGRILDQGEPKYLNSPETPLFQKGHELYGLHQALKINRKLDRALIVEGYMDVIALFQHGITYAVATLGTATTTHHLHRLFRYTAEIIFCFDGDEAGRTAAWRALQVILPVMTDNLQIRFLFLPDGEDPDSLVRKEGKDAFEKRLSNATSLSDFFFQTLAKQCDLNTMEGRARFGALALNHLKELPNGIFQDIMLSELSKRARVALDSLKQQAKITGVTKPETISATAESLESNLAKTRLAPQLKLALALLIQHPQLAKQVPETSQNSQLQAHGFFIQLVDIINQTGYTNTGSIIEYFRDRKEKSFVDKLAQYEHMVPDEAVEKAFAGALKQILALNHDEEINRLLAKAAGEGLSDQEKQDLTTWIGKKKALIL